MCKSKVGGGVHIPHAPALLCNANHLIVAPTTCEISNICLRYSIESHSERESCVLKEGLNGVNS